MDGKSIFIIMFEIALISLNSYCIGRIYEDEKKFLNYVAIVLLYVSIFLRLLWKV